jgi:hypothetical protein
VYSGQEKKKVYEKITSILSSRNDKFKLDMEEKYNYENFKYYFRQLNLPAIDGGYERSHELKNLPKEMKKLIVKIWKKVHEEVLDDDNDDNDY